MMLCRTSLTIRLRGGGTAQTLGNSTMCRTPVANIGKNCIDLVEQQMLIVMNGHLLLKRWRPMMNLLETMTWLDGWCKDWVRA